MLVDLSQYYHNPCKSCELYNDIDRCTNCVTMHPYIVPVLYKPKQDIDLQYLSLLQETVQLLLGLGFTVKLFRYL